MQNFLVFVLFCYGFCEIGFKFACAWLMYVGFCLYSREFLVKFSGSMLISVLGLSSSAFYFFVIDCFLYLLLNFL